MTVNALLVWALSVLFTSFGPATVQAANRAAGAAMPQAAIPPASPQSTLSLEQRADISMARKSYADAVDFYHRALKQPGLSASGQASIWNKLGIAFQQEVNYNAARKAYQESIHRQSDFAEPWNNLGTTYYMENKIKKSVKYYNQSVKLSPSSASFHMNLGTSYYRLKKFKWAVEEYQTALTLNPNILSERSSGGTVMQTRAADSDFYYFLAKSFALVGRADEAVRYLRRAFEDGFKDQKRLADDPDFQKISQNPAYVELMKNLPVPIRE